MPRPGGAALGGAGWHARGAARRAKTSESSQWTRARALHMPHPMATSQATTLRSSTRALGTGASGAAVLLAALLHANPASADLFTSFGGGVFVGYEGGGVIWGLETLASQTVDHACDPRPAYGALARLSLHGLARPSFTLGGFAGRELERDSLGFGLETGVTLAFPNGLENDAAGAFHTGVFGAASVANVSFWQEWLLNEYPVAVGVRTAPTFGPVDRCELPDSAVGRPQRDRDGRRLRDISPIARPSLGSSNPEADLCADWLDNARDEYESVPAFLQLAAELAVLGAPLDLIRRARVAAMEELEHTQICLAVAGGPERASDLPVPRISRRKALTGREGFQRMALESWFDGCLGEGLAARLAADESRSHTVAGVRKAQARIARDEHNHAELAWDILRWCLRVEPEVRGLLKEVRDARVVPGAVRRGDAQRRAAIAARHCRVSQRRLDVLCG